MGLMILSPLAAYATVDDPWTEWARLIVFMRAYCGAKAIGLS